MQNCPSEGDLLHLRKMSADGERESGAITPPPRRRRRKYHNGIVHNHPLLGLRGEGDEILETVVSEA